MSHTRPHTPEMHESPDQWHAHTAEEHPQQAHAEKVNSPLVVVIGIGLFTGVVACVVVLIGYYNWYVGKALNQAEIDGRIEADFRAQRATAESELGQFGWADATAGVVRVPLEMAKEKMLAEYGAKGEAAGGSGGAVKEGTGS